MTSTDAMLAKLGTKSPRMPSGERKVAKALLTAPKSLNKVNRAMGLRKTAVEGLSRVHGGQTYSLDYDTLTPIDIAGALGFVKDPLAREVFCLARWPGYAERDLGETRVLLLRKVMDEGQRRADEFITAWLRVELNSPQDNPREARHALASSKANNWPARLQMYPRIVDCVLRYLDGSGYPDQAIICKQLNVSTRQFRESWKDVFLWTHEELQRMCQDAERQFRAALKDPASV